MADLIKKIALAGMLALVASCSGPLILSFRGDGEMEVTFRSLFSSHTTSPGRFLVPDLAGGSLDVVIRRLDQSKVIFERTLSLNASSEGWLEARTQVKVPLNVELRIQANLKNPSGLTVSSADSVFSADQTAQNLPTPVYLLPTQDFPGLVSLDAGGVMEDNLIVEEGKSRIIALMVKPQDVKWIRKIGWTASGGMEGLSILLRNPKGETISFEPLHGDLSRGLQFQPQLPGIFYIIIHNHAPADGTPLEDKDLGKASAPVSVTFQGNGHTAGNPPKGLVEATSGQTLNIPGAGDMGKEGFKFNGWNTLEDGSGTQYQEGAVLTVGKYDVILYAQWKKLIRVNILYDGNGHTGGKIPDPMKGVLSDQPQVVSGPGNLVRDGHLFAGWNLLKDGSGVTYQPGSSLTPGTSDLTLYALWSPVDQVKVRLEYQGNGHTGGTAPPAVVGQEPRAVLTVAGQGNLVRTGYYFTGWNTAFDGSGKKYAPGDAISLEFAIQVLYAQWAPLPDQRVIISLEDPVDPDPGLSGQKPSLTRGGTLVVTVSGPEWGYYRWTVAGQGTLPVLTGEKTDILTITAGSQTSLGVYTVTLWFGASAPEYSKSFSLQVVE